jgi:hypothetical protein
MRQAGFGGDVPAITIVTRGGVDNDKAILVRVAREFGTAVVCLGSTATIV